MPKDSEPGLSEEEIDEIKEKHSKQCETVMGL